MKKMMQKWGSLSLIICAALLGCGRGNLAGVAPYDPVQNSIYMPAQETHGYSPNEPRTPYDKTYAVIKNTYLRVDPEIGLLIKDLEGELEAKRPGDPIIFDDVRSFTMHVYRSHKVIDGQNITRLMNKYVYNYPDCPLKDIEVSFQPGRIIMKGKMKQVFWVPFEMEGVPHAQPDGTIKMIPDKISTLGIPAKGLMDLIGLQTSKLIQLSEERGTKIEGNAVIMYPTRMFPPPAITGKVVSVRVDNNAFTMFFESGDGRRVPRRPLPDPNVRNFKHIYGGKVLIMNELHRHADLQMVDLDQSDPFDFYLEKYSDHLRAGYVKVMNNQGTLVTLMPDFPKIASTDIWDRYPGPPPRQSATAPPPGSYPPGAYPGSYPGSYPAGAQTYQAQGYQPARKYWQR